MCADTRSVVDHHNNLKPMMPDGRFCTVRRDQTQTTNSFRIRPFAVIVMKAACGKTEKSQGDPWHSRIFASTHRPERRV